MGPRASTVRTKSEATSPDRICAMAASLIRRFCRDFSGGCSFIYHDLQSLNDKQSPYIWEGLIVNVQLG